MSSDEFSDTDGGSDIEDAFDTDTGSDTDTGEVETDMSDVGITDSDEEEAFSDDDTVVAAPVTVKPASAVPNVTATVAYEDITTPVDMSKMFSELSLDKNSGTVVLSSKSGFILQQSPTESNKQFRVRSEMTQKIEELNLATPETSVVVGSMITQKLFYDTSYSKDAEEAVKYVMDKIMESG